MAVIPCCGARGCVFAGAVPRNPVDQVVWPETPPSDHMGCDIMTHITSLRLAILGHTRDTWSPCSATHANHEIALKWAKERQNEI